MDKDLVFAKTEQGKAAIADRSRELSAKQRQLLIMIDGRKRLRDLFPTFDETAIARISGLYNSGLISADQPLPSSALPKPKPDPISAPTSSSASPLRVASIPVPAKLANLRRILAMCSQQYLDDELDMMLMDVFDQLRGPDDLQFCLDQWLSRMQASQPSSITAMYVGQVQSLL